MVSPVVIKVGGSLFDWPQLRPNLLDWLKNVDGPPLLVPGGGRMVEEVRAFDRRHLLGEEAAHWLALRVVAVNAHLLAAVLPQAEVVETLEACPRVWQREGIAVLDAYAFLRADEGCEGSLPHSWAVTSDSIAARVARRARARRLVLLKSVDSPVGGDWTEAGRLGYVDAWFAHVVGSDLRVEVVNLRRQPG